MKSIKDYENIALSNTDIFKILGGNAKLVLYPNLIKYKSIDDVLGGKPVILLFEAKKNYGHWTALWKKGNTIYFFNPYGGYPDDGLKYIPEHFAKLNNENVPYLSILLYNSPYKLNYNEYQYQRHDPDIKTCGRHVAVRLLFKSMSDSQYHKFIKNFTKKYNIDADKLVTLLTI